jgi:Zn-dependent protease
MLQQGSFRLFRVAGIEVFLHWSWFLIAVYGISNRSGRYSSLVWPVIEYVALFLIVLLHEFGHSLACRSVGGKADRIVLWPLGGIAFVDPPPRPGPTLWSIAAGPLVNVMLVPVFGIGLMAVSFFGISQTWPDAYHLLYEICMINIGLLIFNLMPIYPLDGGQIVQSLLWFVLGRARSLMVTTIVGFVGAAGLVVLALLSQQPMLWVVTVFILLNCWGGLMHARLMSRIARLPRRDGFACPACGERPPIGEFWRCSKCLKPFDTFASQATCPHCGTAFPVTRCISCGNVKPMNEWITATAAVPPPL